MLQINESIYKKIKKIKKIRDYSQTLDSLFNGTSEDM